MRKRVTLVEQRGGHHAGSERSLSSGAMPTVGVSSNGGLAQTASSDHPDYPIILVHIPGPLRRYCGGAGELVMQAASVRDLLEDLERNQPALYCNICDETGRVRRHVNVFINSSHMRDCQGLDTALAGDDVVTILPAVSGG